EAKPMLCLMQRPAGHVQHAALVSMVPAPRGLSDVRSDRIRGAHQLDADRPQMDGWPREHPLIDVVRQRPGQTIRNEVPESTRLHDHGSRCAPNLTPATCDLRPATWSYMSLN